MGWRLRPTVGDAYAKALKTDPTSAFGGVIAFNRAVDAPTAESVARQFVEVVIAPEFTAEARAAFGAKPNVRLLSVPVGDAHNDFDFKRVGGGLLVQTSDDHALQASELKVVTVQKPTAQQVDDLMFAWKVAKFVKSNAIVFVAPRSDARRRSGTNVARRFGADRFDQGRVGRA